MHLRSYTKPFLLTLSLGLVLVLVPLHKSHAMFGASSTNIYPFATSFPPGTASEFKYVSPNSTTTINGSSTPHTIFSAIICPATATTSIGTTFIKTGYDFGVFGYLPIVVLQEGNNECINSGIGAWQVALPISIVNQTNIGYFVTILWYNGYISNVTSSLPVTSMSTTTDTVINLFLNAQFLIELLIIVCLVAWFIIISVKRK